MRRLVTTFRGSWPVQSARGHRSLPKLDLPCRHGGRKRRSNRHGVQGSQRVHSRGVIASYPWLCLCEAVVRVRGKNSRTSKTYPLSDFLSGPVTNTLSSPPLCSL